MEGLIQDPQTLKSRDSDATLNRGILDKAPMHNVDIIGIPKPDGLYLRVVVTASRRIHEEDTVDYILKEFCEIILTLNLAL